MRVIRKCLYCGRRFSPTEPGSGQRYCVPCGTTPVTPCHNDRDFTEIQQRTYALVELRRAFREGGA